MCGIVGIYCAEGINSNFKVKLRDACNKMQHRGPDESGYWYDDSNIVSFGHRRLSIIDIKSGQQPMMNEKGNLVITFNGEIYNFQELRQELTSKGFIFRTNSDTEVILNLYDAYGTDSFERLNGIFAFGIYDLKKKELIIARDQYGVKPVYYIDKFDTVAFASEIKALLELNIVQKEVDVEALNGNIAYRFSPSPETLFKDVKKLYPGCYIKVNKYEVRLGSYVKFVPNIDTSISIEDALSKYSNLLNDAVKRQMMSDVPVGMLLSGGIDSAIVCNFMQANSNDNIHTYTVGFEGVGKYNELAFAKETANILGTNHNELIISEKEYFDFFEWPAKSLL